MILDFQTLAQVFSGRVLNTMAEGLALVGLSWLALRLSRMSGAVTRFAVWFSTLTAVTIMPFLVRNESPVIPHRTGVVLSSSWANGLFLAWLGIAGLLVIRLCISLWHVHALRRQCNPADSPELVEKIARHANGRSIRLLISDEVRVPTALGFLKPAIVLPRWTLEQLSSEELNAVLLHELAHLRRYDDWTNLAQKILKAVFFFHPAVWFIENRLALEREMACDDFVLRHATNAGSYAASLISLAEKALGQNTRLRRSFALAQNALGRVKQMSLRIAEILRPKRSPAKPWGIFVGAASVLAVALLATPYAPKVVSFHGPASGYSAATTAIRQSEIRLSVPAIRASLRVPVGGSSSARKRITAVVPAKAKSRHFANSKLVLTKAQVKQPAQPKLLLFRSTDLDGFGSPMWSFAVWRVTYESNGTTHIETIVMSSI
jgi:beta-lactamase regulating signal transducer with metallopeptidase domain